MAALWRPALMLHPSRVAWASGLLLACGSLFIWPIPPPPTAATQLLWHIYSLSNALTALPAACCIYTHPVINILVPLQLLGTFLGFVLFSGSKKINRKCSPGAGRRWAGQGSWEQMLGILSPPGQQWLTVMALPDIGVCKGSGEHQARAWLMSQRPL